MEKIKKFIQPVICVLSLVFLFVCPFITGDFGYGVEASFSGFIMASNTYIGFLLIVLPVLLILASFSPKYSSKKSKWSVVIPAILIVSWLATVLYAKFFLSGVADSAIGSGAYLSLICYVALLVYGFIFHRKEFDEIIEKVKK
ncbi:MAG: hypothetical protein IKV88_04420 [Clostridia bacterium]|nr:hypothetical protein [Clostridia bacterium]